jgi:hypothetical protein
MESGGPGLYIQALERGPSGVLAWKVHRDNFVLHYVVRTGTIVYVHSQMPPPSIQEEGEERWSCFCPTSAVSGPRDGIAGGKKETNFDIRT